MERVSQSGLTFYRRQAWNELRHGIFTRRGGVSESHWSSLNLGATIGDQLDAVKENHLRMYRAVGVNQERAVSSWLVHGVKTMVIDNETQLNDKLERADAIITDQPDTPLVMRFADCVPLLLYDPERRAIGLGHAGWRGTVNGMAANTVRMMQSAFGCRPKDLQVVIGPAISRRNYQVGEEIAEQALAYFGEHSGLIVRDSVDATPYFDLWRANQLDFERQGVADAQVLEICTFENTDEFFSHRAENGLTGRFGVVISL